MKNIGNNLGTVKKMFALAVLCTVISGCTIEPVQFERDVLIPGAPEWVNKGSRLSSQDGERVFLGVSSSNPRGDLALQRSVADDNSMLEVTLVLSSYLEAVANDYMTIGRARENGASKEVVERQLADAAARQIKEGVAYQIDEAMLRQFKEKPSRQFRDDVTRQINEDALRQIKEAVASQIDFSHELEEVIARQINAAVSRQIKSVIKPSMAGARIIGSWRDPKTATVWSLSELDMKYVKNTMAGAGDMSAELKHHFETNADNVFDRMIDEKNNPTAFYYK